MKKYIILFLAINSLNSMEQQIIKREPREWNAQAYDEGNSLQTNTFLQFIKENNIKIENKDILSAGCGTGRIENILAEKAKHIHGFDASKNMIDFAQNKYGHIKNLSFEHCFAEDFKSQKLYQLALASFCLHWVEDKKLAFQRINDSLEVGGEFFGTVQTLDNPQPIDLKIAAEMMPSIQEAIKSLNNQAFPNLNTHNTNNTQAILGSSYLSHEEFNTLLKETGFEIIKSEEQCYHNIMSKSELEKLYWPIFISRPFIKVLPEEKIKVLFDDFITRYISKIEKHDDSSFFNKHFTTLIHARKIQK